MPDNVLSLYATSWPPYSSVGSDTFGLRFDAFAVVVRNRGGCSRWAGMEPERDLEGAGGRSASMPATLLREIGCALTMNS